MNNENLPLIKELYSLLIYLETIKKTGDEEEKEKVSEKIFSLCAEIKKNRSERINRRNYE